MGHVQQAMSGDRTLYYHNKILAILYGYSPPARHSLSQSLQTILQMRIIEALGKSHMDLESK